MESKLSMLFGLLLIQALVQIISGHGPEGKLGNITFRCASDEDFADGYCLTVVDAPMIWKDADRACKRKGQALMYAADADEHMYIDHFARRTWEYYWTGLNRLNTSLAPNEVGWSHNADKVDFADLIWENDQPERDNGDCVYTKKNGYKSFGNCRRRLPFICKSEAVLKGFFRCRNGLGIQTKFVCDGHNDCGDRSDENNCPDIQNICSEVIDATTTTSGTISSAGISANKKTCYWSIITNIGSTIKVTVNTFNTERNADVMDFTTGGLQGIIVLAELGGNVQGLPITFFSSDNVFNMRFLTDDTILKAGFSISWTTDVPEIFSDVQMLTATSTMQSLKSPFYDTNYLVHEKVFEWIITSNTVITLQFVNMDIDDKGKLYLWDDDEISLNSTLDVNELPEDYIFISRSKTVRLMLVSGADSFTFSKGIHIKYWEGCDINLQANKGTIYSPGSKADSYPDNVKCTWTMQRETSETRPMSLRFTEFKLQQDKDFLKVYNDTGDDSPVHSGQGFTDTVIPPPISSTTGYIKAEFTSDYVLTDDGFSADFSLDCPKLVVSSQTHVTYTEGTLFNSEVTVSCDTGYSFMQEEYNTESSVKMNCMKGGKWDKDRTPNCMDCDGSSCQLIQNHCAYSDTCKNEGTCMTKDMGFQCECKSSYEGDTCETYKDPCDPNPCHSSAKCISEENRHMCYCAHGRLLTDEGCKVPSDPRAGNFDLLLDSRVSPVGGFLRTPFVWPTDSNITVMFWTRIKEASPSPLLVSLEASYIGALLPTWNPALWTTIIYSDKVIANNFQNTSTIEFGTDVADGKWHFLVVSWDQTGHIKIFIDSIKKVDQTTLSADSVHPIMYAILGYGTYGRLSKLNVYRKTYSDEKLILARASYNHFPIDDLVQGWYNVALTHAVTKICPSKIENETICDTGIQQGCPVEDREKPTVTCPANKIKTATGRLTSFTGLMEGSYSDNVAVTSESSSVHEDEVYFYGSRNEALVGYDAAGNYGICRFKVYVKYNDDCPAPATDATVENCTGNSGNICGLQCPANQILSMKHPFRYNCGMLGIYNQVNPWMKFVVPTCGEKAEQTVDLTVSMSFELSLDCYAAAQDGIKTKVEDQIKGYIATNWPDLCRSPCTPTVNSECRDRTKFVDAVFTLHSLGSETTKNSVTYKMREAILIVILTENVFGGFSGIAGADLQKDTVTVTESPSCPADFVVIGDECVKCGKGTYRNETTMSCQYCAVGMYKTTVGPTSCTSCGSGKTTVTYGSYSSSDCIDDCSIGHEYKGSECVECERHYYQDRSGLDYCLPCPLGTKTSVKGSNSSTSCYEDCPAGTELQPDGSCKDCRRGYYRSQADDNCLSCEDVRPGMTTEDIKSATSSDCNIKICLAGKFRNATTNECEPCKVGEYNPEDLQDSCEECPTSYTTDGEGKTHRDNCTFYCDAGEEVMSAESKSCRSCPRGTYRSLHVDEILEPCQNCSHGNTTENTRSTSKEQCTIKRCEAGQKLDDTGACEDCHADYYQPNDHPDSNTVCTACDDDKGTRQPKSDSEDNCILVCSAGEQNNGDSCAPCPQGTWNSGDMNMRFDQCSNCTDQDYTTVGQGSTHPDNCTLRDCDPGYYISGSNCLPCGFAQYQPMRHQEMCLNCLTDQNTSSEASTSQSDCQIYCLEGTEGNVTCTPCKEDYYKSVAGISACKACTGNYTSNAAKVACTEIFCDRGFYNDNDNCIVCPVGQYKHVRGNAQSCTPCDSGWTTPGVGSEAESECNVLFCVPGKFENTTSNQCEPCKVKTYKASSGNQACTDCPQNKTTQGTTSTMASDCSVEFCDPGERRTTNNKCEPCAVGYYQPDAGEDSCIGCDTGYTTDSSGKTLKSDCYEICRAGFQFDPNNKVCIGCALGYYKDVVGNSVNCSECPAYNTTGNVNSTSISDCNIPDCQPGYRREAGGLGCVKCEIGKYQPQRSQPSCLSCGSNKTTKSTGSSKLAECIIKCGDGLEADYQGGCKACEQGFFSNAANKECTACPNGQTTSLGSNVCITNTITTLSPPARRKVMIEFTYRGSFACDDQNIKENVRGTVIKQMTVLALVYTSLCYPDTTSCTNIKTLSISVSVCDVAGRKRAADNVITYDVEVNDVPDSMTNIDTSATRPTSSVLQEDLTVNKESYNPLPKVLTIEDAKVQSIAPQCPEGSVVNNQDCKQCPVGTYYDSSNATCLQCPYDEYQTLTGQSSCTPCTGVKKYTLAKGSNSSSYCVSECVKTVDYCNTGSCRDDFSLTCVCPDEYEGVTCQTRKKTSSTPAIIGGTIGGGVALLILITIIIIVCSRFYGSNKSEQDSDSRKFGRYNDTESDAPYRNPIYDNMAYRSGHLPITYGGGWPNEYPGGHDPYAPYIAQKHLRTFDSDNEEGTTGRSPRRTQHEWYAA